MRLLAAGAAAFSGLFLFLAPPPERERLPLPRQQVELIAPSGGPLHPMAL